MSSITAPWSPDLQPQPAPRDLLPLCLHTETLCCPLERPPFLFLHQRIHGQGGLEATFSSPPLPASSRSQSSVTHWGFLTSSWGSPSWQLGPVCLTAWPASSWPDKVGPPVGWGRGGRKTSQQGCGRVGIHMAITRLQSPAWKG